MRKRIIVVGGGLSGLAAGSELATHSDVHLVERLPAAGGTWEFDHPAVKALLDECAERGVQFSCGHTALRWVDRQLLTIGPGRRAWWPADHLVFAGGTRPATPAELPVLGARTAGVFVATVAHHLLEAHIVLGTRIAICGGGYWAGLVVNDLPTGTHVLFVGEGPPPTAPPGVSIEVLSGHRPVQVNGRDRVEALVTERDGQLTTSPCHAVVLAGDLKPLRNVDGAIVDRPDVTFIQPTATTLTARRVIHESRDIAAALHAKETQ